MHFTWTSKKPAGHNELQQGYNPNKCQLSSFPLTVIKLTCSRCQPCIFLQLIFFPGFKELSQKKISWVPTQQARATVNYNNSKIRPQLNKFYYIENKGVQKETKL